MTPHDELMSALIKMKKQLEAYVDEFKPDGGVRAEELMSLVCVYASNFVRDN